MKTVIALLLTLSFIPSLRATTISVSSSPGGRAVESSNNILLPNGDLVQIGTFSNAAAISGLLTPSAIMAAAGWSKFGGDKFTSTQIGNSGKINGSFTDDSTGVSSTANPFNGKDVYLWIYNASTIAAATQQGIFRGTTAAWVFPNNGGGLGDSTTVILDEGTLAAQGITPVGSVSATRLTLVPIVPAPEPTTGALVCFGVAALAARRRRSLVA